MQLVLCQVHIFLMAMYTSARENYPISNKEMSMKTLTEREIYLLPPDNSFWYSNGYCTN